MTEVAYPPDLARWVVERWPTDDPLPVSPEALDQALATVFLASMTTEEARPARFRVILVPADALPLAGQPNHGVLRLKFDRTRPFDVEELRRLAPASPFETSLVGAQEEADGALGIWGIAHSGPEWLAPSWGGRDQGPIWTTAPILHVNGPGQIAVRRAGVLVGALEHGRLLDTTIDVFESEWLPAQFAREREEVRTHVAAAQSASAAPSAIEASLIGRISQNMLRRCIQLIRGAQHGGLVLVDDVEATEVPDADGLRLKYRFDGDEPTRRYRALVLELLETFADSSGKASLDWSDYVRAASAPIDRLEKAIFEWSRVLANLAAIDGAVVVDKRFALVGFGAEVAGHLPAPRLVWRALDREGARRRPEQVDSVGTRHRAAYRFVHDRPGGLGIVVSHDGAVTFVANHGGDVVVWEQVTRP